MILSLVLAHAALTADVTLSNDQAAGDVQAQIDELNRRLELLSGELERQSFDEVIERTKDAPRTFGVSPIAGAVYASDGSVSLGGYGEAFYQNRAGSGDNADSLRTVLYVGKRFDDSFVFNAEIEFEHGGTSGGGSASAEFAYLDWLLRPELNLRAGLVLVPMGIVNELHEPTTFLPSRRSLIEQRIIPSTWRENGIGAFGDVGDFSYSAYVVNGLDAGGFSDEGLRGGRQKGSEALAEDLAVVLGADYTARPGFLAGGSVYVGDSGQGQAGLGDAGTRIAEAHVDVQMEGWRARGLYALAEVDDVATLNAGLGLVGADSVGEELNGGYVELGYDVFALCSEATEQSLVPFVRYELFDTQSKVPTGFASNAANDEEVLTFGLFYQPISSVVLKLDYEDYDQGTDRWNASIGYIF